MKKVILFCGFILLSNCLFGQDFFSNYSLTLSPFADSKAIRAENNKWPAFVLNLLVGVGVGSFVQGDTTGGIVGLCGELGGFALIIAGIIPEQTYHPGYYYGYYTIEYPNIALTGVGFAVFLGTRIFELVRPFTYANSFSVALSPILDAEGKPALTAMIKLKL